jgi:hypothetical protein
MCFASSSSSSNPPVIATAAAAELSTPSAAPSNTDFQEKMKASLSSSSSHGPYYRPVTEATMTLLEKDERVRTKFHEGTLTLYVAMFKCI